MLVLVLGISRVMFFKVKDLCLESVSSIEVQISILSSFCFTFRIFLFSLFVYVITCWFCDTTLLRSSEERLPRKYGNRSHLISVACTIS